MKYFIIVYFFAQSLLASGHFSGQYVQECRVIGDDYLQFSIEIRDSSFAFKVTAFEDEDCLTPYLRYDQYFSIELNQNEILNLRTEKVTYTALSEEVASALRMISYCGISSWQVNNETDVTAKNCDGFIQLARGEIFYQILQLQNNVLNFGLIDENRDGRSVQTRPVQFDQADYFSK